MPTEESLVAAFQKLDEKGQDKDQENKYEYMDKDKDKAKTNTKTTTFHKLLSGPRISPMTLDSIAFLHLYAYFRISCRFVCFQVFEVQYFCTYMFCLQVKAT